MPSVNSTESRKVLFVNSEIYPYLPESEVAVVGRYLPQGIQERGYEIRSFMPRYGCVNERRNQLHEVIRLSGMNIVVGAVDRQLIIKVAMFAVPLVFIVAGYLIYLKKFKISEEFYAQILQDLKDRGEMKEDAI